MAGVVDEISPDFVGAEAIGLSLADPLVPILAHRAIGIQVDYAETFPAFVALPIEVTIQGPNPDNFIRKIHTRSPPKVVTFTPKDGGTHTVLVREVSHNKWYGTLDVEVLGETSEPKIA